MRRFLGMEQGRHFIQGALRCVYCRSGIVFHANEWAGWVDGRFADPARFESTAMSGGIDSSSIFPMTNPPFFFQRREFDGERGRPASGPALSENIRIHAQSDVLKGELLSPFNQVALDRFGVLRGDYFVIEHGFLLIDRQGDCIVANWPPDNQVMAKRLNELCNTEHLWARRAEIVANWDSYPTVEHAAVVSSVFSGNYAHCTLELVAGFRFFDDLDVRNVVIAPHCLEKRFQLDLISRAMGSLKAIPISGPLKVRDPVLVSCSNSEEGLAWIRAELGQPTRRGARRYYIRRKEDKRVIGNNLSEDPKLTQLLKEHDFEPIDFGGGEYSIAEQVAMLDGAQIILAVHGANLTNIAYLSAPLTIIEFFGRKRFSAVYAQISASLGFRHFGVISDVLDDNGDVVVDCDLLSEILREIAA